MTRMLPRSFFDRPADFVARELIGCTLCVRKDGVTLRHPIAETEAYMGPHDLACHASKGRTKRTETMFQNAGTIYVYLIYGMYEMLNIVTGPKDYPAAVLIRGAGPFDGPGKLAKALSVTREQNGKRLGRQAGLWIEKSTEVTAPRITRTPRIGIHYAHRWTDKKLRFVRRDNV